MQESYRNPLTREDTLLGVCQAIGDDFGFNPIYLRIALAFGVLWNPVAVAIAYLALGVAVLTSRLVAPQPKTSERTAAQAAPAMAERVEADTVETDEDFRVAA